MLRLVAGPCHAHPFLVVVRGVTVDLYRPAARERDFRDHFGFLSVDEPADAPSGQQRLGVCVLVLGPAQHEPGLIIEESHGIHLTTESAPPPEGDGALVTHLRWGT